MLPMQRELNRTFFAVLALPATAMGFALSVQIAALSWILTTQYGLDVHDIGLVWAAGPLAGIFGQVLIGAWSDRVWVWRGRRRPFILVGGTIAALALLALPNIDVISPALGVEGLLGVAIVIVLTLDFAINVSFNPTRSIIADVTPEGVDRTKGFSWMQTMSGTFSVGAYAIGWFFDNYVLIYTGVIVVFLFSILPPLFVEEPEIVEAETNAHERKLSIPDMLQAIQPLWGFLIYDVYAMTLRIAGIEPEHYYAEIVCGALTIALIVKSLLDRSPGRFTGFRQVLAAHSFSWIGIHTTLVFLVIFLKDVLPDLDDINLGRATTLSYGVLNAVAAILPVFVLEPLTEKIGRVRTHAGCLAIMAAGYVMMYLFGYSQMTILLFMAVLGIGWASIISLPFAIISQKADKSEMGLYMGLFNLSVVLPQLVVSLGISLAISRAENPNIIWVISAVAITLSAIAWTRVRDE